MGSASNSPWVPKGGNAMELRYRKARATKDLDFTMRLISQNTPGKEEVSELLQQTTSADMEDFFIYRIGEATADDIPMGSFRFRVKPTVLMQKLAVAFLGFWCDVIQSAQDKLGSFVLSIDSDTM
jgi:hypothetical protein